MEDLKNFFNILFFLTMSIVAVLSYIQARKTLFSPIKTEIFKIQVEEFKAVLAFFNKKSSFEFDEEYGFQEIFQLNVLKMQQEYIATFFSNEVELSDELLEKISAASYGGIISEKDAEVFFKKITPGSELKEKKGKEHIRNIDPALKLAKWQDYRHVMTHYTKKFHEKHGELSKLSASPLLPKDLTDLMYEFSSAIDYNLKLIGDVLSEESQQMQKKYTTAEDIIKFNPNWIWNSYNHKRKDIDEITSKILLYIRDYLKIKDLMR